MDDKELDALFGIAGSANAQPTPATPSQQASEGGGLEIDAGQVQSLMGAIQAGVQGMNERPSSLPDALLKGLSAPGVANPDAPAMSPEQSAEAAAVGGAGLVTGGLKSVFETKDFLFGDTPPEEQSAFRRTIEQRDADMKQASPIIGGLSSGIGQFAVAMIGLGKVGMVAKAVPAIGSAVGAVSGLRGGAVGLEAGKAALAGAIAFDPHEARLSNLIQDTPLANPFNAWLAAGPDDSAAMGRLKNAMESLGMDAAIIGTFAGSLRILKALKSGDEAAAGKAVSSLEAEQRAHLDAEQADALPTANAAGDGMELRQGATPEGGIVDPAPSPEAQPVAAVVDEVSEATIPGTKPGTTDTPVAASETISPEAGARQFRPVVDFTAQELSGIPARPGSMDIPKPGLLDDMDLTLENAEKDWDKLELHGNWGKLKAAGQDLSPDMGTFYNRFRTDEDVLQWMDLAVNQKAEQLTASGFRVRLTDAQLQRQVQSFALMADIHPAELEGMLAQAGEASKTLTAKMVVSGSLASKAFTDASVLAMRRKMGDYTEFGGLENMEAEIARRFSVATTFLKYTDEMRAQAGRTLRANRGKPFDASLFEGLSKDRFYDLLAEAQANPAVLKTLADPNLYRKIMDTVNYMRISSLVSGPKTQLINIMTSGYMLGVRPLERILGSVGGAVQGNVASKALIRENLKQYAYMGTALMDGWSMAIKAFARNDGILKPHSSEAYGELSNVWKVPGTQAIGKGYFKPWNSTGNLIHNALSMPLTAVGVAPRALGGVDELVKQVTYRSKVMASAHMDGVEKALDAGLKGQEAKDYVASYVKQRLNAAFDADGRGLDPKALQEADIATFQQDLLPGTLGKVVQDGIANERTQLMRLVLPFVKTPTNVLRYGWKMTPGLNLLQGEFRQMLSGKLGLEARAQAIGQMSMGALFLGTGGYLASQGMITGGGPADPQLKAQLMATGWQPYSFVFENDDGTKTYVSYGRFDPVALPFGIIADIQDSLAALGDDAEGSPEIEDAIGALLISLTKSFSSRTYLLSLNQAVEAVSDPDKSGSRFVGGLAQSMVPFSSFTRQTSSDPYLRDARTIADKMMQVIPGLSSDLPPRFNWAGQPVLNRQGLWTDDNGSLVDKETQRLGLEGYRIGQPAWKLGSKGSEVDLRTITLTTGENAYTKLQQLAGKPTPRAKSLRDAVAGVMRSDAYERAPDGDSGVRGTRMWILSGAIGKYREAATKQIRADKNVRDALMKLQRKVPDHYQHLKVAPDEEQKAGLQAILDGFGAGSSR